MLLQCIMDVVIYLILCSCGIQAILPTVAFSSEPHQANPAKVDQPATGHTVDSLTEQIGDAVPLIPDWECPHVTDIAKISCTCDIPHTIRCRGQSSGPQVLFNLTNVLRDAEDHSTNVSLLDLAIHGVQHLEPLSFDGLSLLGLVISSAGLRSLASDSFKGLEMHLAALGLPGNELTSVPSDSLQLLRKLRRLDLSDNELEILYSREFPTLLQLRNLNLAGNHLRTIEPEAFVRLPQLKTLLLDRNQLDASQMNDKTLRGLHFLQNLSLQSNLLKGSLSAEFLNSAPKLISLNLSNNSFTKISFGALEFCKSLESLDLSHNKIDIISDHAFKHLSQLKHLQLSHNHIIAVSGWSLAHLPNLVSLSLADNGLFAVTADLLHQLHNLTSLDLSANDISLLQPDVFNFTPSISSINLSDNPLHCDCSISWFLSWLHSHSGLSDEDRRSVVCTTPPVLENAPLIDLNVTDLTCSKEFSDYYHDEADYEELYDFRMSDAEVSLQTATWVDDVVQLVWVVDQRAVPYTCQGVHIYEMENVEGSVHQILAEKMEVNCSSESQLNPHQIVVSVPGSLLRPGGVYRYCLVLLEHGTDDEGSFLPGCSEALLLSVPSSEAIIEPQTTKVTSLTAGNMGMSLIVQTRVSSYSIPCSYSVYVIEDKLIVASGQLNCSEPRHTFKSVDPGFYIVCVEPDKENSKLNLSKLQEKLKSSSNTTALLSLMFPACTTVQMEEEHRSGWTSGPLLTLLFTLPGLALIITLYIIGRRLWKGGGVPWRWDPRASKRAKYFLYTGETTTPTASLDPLPAPIPESSV